MSEARERPGTIYKRIVQEGWLKAKLQEFFSSALGSAGFHRLELVKTPIREVITIYTDRPGTAIGRGGSRIKEITEELKERFGFRNPYLRVEKVQKPLLVARIIADNIARRMLRGERHRRAAFSALRLPMTAGAKGVEIRIAGKFGRRARQDRFRAGVIYRCGGDYLSEVSHGVRQILMPQGTLGIRVKIVKPDIELPGQPEIRVDEIERMLGESSGEEIEEGEIEEGEEEEVTEGAVEEGAEEEVTKGAVAEGGRTEESERGGPEEQA